MNRIDLHPSGAVVLPEPLENFGARLWRRRSSVIAVFSATAILLHVILRYGVHTAPSLYQVPLFATLFLGGLPQLYDLLRRVLKREFGSDLLGGLSIITSVWLGEYLAGSIIVLMMSGGETLEAYALRSASSVLGALAKRMPSVAHRQRAAVLEDIALADIAVGDLLVIYPHEVCPADGVVTEGHRLMDESYLTGEPFQITKTSGSNVISGAVNGESALTFRTTQLTADSRYAKIMEVMRVIALQSAVGGMLLSLVGMAFAASGHLSPVSGAIAQEVIDLLSVLNALRAAFPPKVIHDL